MRLTKRQINDRAVNLIGKKYHGDLDLWQADIICNSNVVEVCEECSIIFAKPKNPTYHENEPLCNKCNKEMEI